MRFKQLAQTDSLLQFFDLSWMNDSLLIGLYLAFFQSRWLSCQAYYAPMPNNRFAFQESIFRADLKNSCDHNRIEKSSRVRSPLFFIIKAPTFE